MLFTDFFNTERRKKSAATQSFFRYPADWRLIFGEKMGKKPEKLQSDDHLNKK